jgi:hypothetical protein
MVCSDLGRNLHFNATMSIPTGGYNPMEDFLRNTRDYLNLQGDSVSELEEIIHIVFDVRSRYSIKYSCNQMLLEGIDEDLLEGVLDSDLPAVVSQALGKV